MNDMRKFFESTTKDGISFFGVSIGKIKHLFDRYRNYLAWFQIPLLLYTAVISTMSYFPALSGHLLEIMVVGFVGFFIFASIVMFIDLKIIFPSEREFMYSGTPYFERKFKELDEKLDRGLKDDKDLSDNAGG